MRKLIYYVVIALICAANLIPATIVANAAGNVGISYQFEDTYAGTAGGIITVSGANGAYDLYWGIGSNKYAYTNGSYTIPYSSFAKVDVIGGSSATRVYSYVNIPENANTVLAYDNTGALCGQYSIPQGKLFNMGYYDYSYGALSDIHYNRYGSTSAGVFTDSVDDSVFAFDNALDVLEKTDVSFVTTLGDITNIDKMTATVYQNAMQKYSTATANRRFPVYTASGNHDAGGSGFTASFLQYFTSNVNVGIDDPQSLASRGIVTIASNKLDFVYISPESMCNDVFIFLATTRDSKTDFVKAAQLDWLEQQLDLYQDKRVYLMFHMPISNIFGREYDAVGNVMGPNGYVYDFAMDASCEMQIRFKEIIYERTNVIYFSGHTHWEYDMQQYQENANIGTWDYVPFPTLVHISSVSEPRTAYTTTPKDDRVGLNGVKSEGYIVKVYEKGIVLLGVSFYDDGAIANDESIKAESSYIIWDKKYQQATVPQTPAKPSNNTNNKTEEKGCGAVSTDGNFFGGFAIFVLSAVAISISLSQRKAKN